MVQPNGVPEEITGNDMVNNIIDQASADIDRELATESQAQPLTADQVQQIVQTQLSQVQNQISGLQSLYDKGLNAIRRDSESMIQQMQQQTTTQQNQAQLNSGNGKVYTPKRSTNGFKMPVYPSQDQARYNFDQTIKQADRVIG